MRYFTTIAMIVAGLTAPAIAAPKDYAAAISPKGRLEKQIALDASRKPMEILDFLGLKRGMAVFDVMAGGGYYSQIMGRVIGPKARVIAYEPAQFLDADSRKEWAPILAAQPNINLMVLPLEQFIIAPNSFDFTMLHLTYHDFYWSSEKFKVPKMDPDKMVAQLFRATKPGGVVGVVDHVGRAGDTRAIVDKVHRIDPAIIKSDFARAGFVLEAQSDLLRTDGDNPDMLVFNPAVRGRTDRVVYRFRKPG